MFNLEERCPFDCVTSKGVEIIQKQQFHTFLKVFSEVFMLWDYLFFRLLNHYPKCLVVFIFHPPAMTSPLSHS